MATKRKTSRKTSAKRKERLQFVGKLVFKTTGTRSWLEAGPRRTEIVRPTTVVVFEWIAFDAETDAVVSTASTDSQRYFGTRLYHQLSSNEPLCPSLQAALEHAVKLCRQQLNGAEQQVVRLRRLVAHGVEVMTQLDERQLKLF